MDALADNTPIALEMKRYGSTTKLDQRELQGEITEAARVYPHLQLWVLVTTTGLDALAAQALRDSAAAQGLFVLILDNTDTQAELPYVPSIAAVCAGYPEITLQGITNPDWHDRKRSSLMPPRQEVHDELQAIRALPRFPQWHERFRTELTTLPLEPFITKKQNRRLAQILRYEARTVFGTDFDASQVVPRTAKQQIEAWFQQAIKTYTSRTFTRPFPPPAAPGVPPAPPALPSVAPARRLARPARPGRRHRQRGCRGGAAERRC